MVLRQQNLNGRFLVNTHTHTLVESPQHDSTMNVAANTKVDNDCWMDTFLWPNLEKELSDYKNAEEVARRCRRVLWSCSAIRRWVQWKIMKCGMCHVIAMQVVRAANHRLPKDQQIQLEQIPVKSPELPTQTEIAVFQALAAGDLWNNA